MTEYEKEQEVIFQKRLQNALRETLLVTSSNLGLSIPSNVLTQLNHGLKKMRPRKLVSGVYETDVVLRWFYLQLKQHVSLSVKFPCSAICAAALAMDVLQFKIIPADTVLSPRFLTVHEEYGGRLIITTKERPPRLLLPSSLSSNLLAPFVFRDDSLLVVSKPPNILSVPGIITKHSAESILKANFPEIRMVHRLDFETSGILVGALTRGAAQNLSMQFRNRTMKKQYIALCAGKLTPASGVFSFPLARASDKSEWLMQKVDDVAGLPSRTEYEVVSYDAQLDQTRVRLFPVTGRTHQLRVHLAYFGFPIVGDSLYGTGARIKVQLSREPDREVARMFLHAESLAFSHPMTLEKLIITSPCPF